MIFYGEIECQEFKRSGAKCTNGAYFYLNEKYVCGVHSLKEKEKRIKLSKNTKEEKNQQQTDRENIIEEVAKINRENGTFGSLFCYQMRMMKSIKHKDGYLNIFPNYKYQNRSDGFGCSSLSPMMIGPIDHGQLGLPICLNLENFHQGNKVYKDEVDSNGNLTQNFYDTRLQMYNDPKPHRHKRRGEIPLYSIWVTKNGVEKKINYIGSRQFYCNFYERHVRNLKDFVTLKNLIQQGYNLQICGYDAYQPCKSIEEHYLDGSKPFGHELVLYTMLSLNEEEYPWRKFKTEDF